MPNRRLPGAWALACALALAPLAHAQPPVASPGGYTPLASVGYGTLGATPQAVDLLHPLPVFCLSGCSGGGGGGGGGSGPSATIGGTFGATVSPLGLNVGAAAQGWSGLSVGAGLYAGLVSLATALPAGANAIGSVTVSNLPATQPVSGSISVSNLPTTQAVSGAVTVANLPATQPVSGTVTTISGTGALATLPGIPGSGYGVALPAGATGTMLYLPTSTDSVTYTVEPAATCGASAPGPTVTFTGAQGPNLPENLSGVVVCLTAATGADLRVRAY